MTLQSVIANSNKVPGTYLKVSLGVGARSAGDSTKFVLIIANKTSAGTGVVETEYDIFSEDEARTLGGAGSEAFLMCRAALRAWPGVAIKLMLATASGGTAASGTIVFASTAGAAGTVQVTCIGETIEVAVASGDAHTVTSVAVAAAINDQTDWPITASESSGTVTCTAKIAGPRGNQISVRARLVDVTTMTVTPPSGGYLASGATDDNHQNVLDAQATLRRTFIATPAQDATQLARYRTHVNTQDDPEVGHRKQVIWASLDSLANTTTVATGLNAERMCCAWMYTSDWTAGMIAAAVAAIRAREESNEAATNYDGMTVPNLPAHYTKANIPTNTQQASALNNGISPITSTTTGEAAIVRLVTNKSQDSASNPDYRVLDVHKVSVPDFVADDLEVGVPAEFVDSPKASDNPPEGQSPAPRVTTPDMVRDFLISRLFRAERELGLLDSGSVEANLGNLHVELSKVAKGRFNASIPLDVVELFHQAAIDVRQIG